MIVMRRIAQIIVWLFVVLTTAKISWNDITNPVLHYPDWSIKDPTMALSPDGSFFLVSFSAFYSDPSGTISSQVVGVTTTDFVKFSKPLFNLNGSELGYLGMCSPNVYKHQPNPNEPAEYILTLNSWGDKPSNPNALFYMVSTDLLNWTPYKPIKGLTKDRAIDAAVAYDLQMQKFVLIYKKRVNGVDMGTVCFSATMDGNFQEAGEAKFYVNSTQSKDDHENFSFMWNSQSKLWFITSSDYNPAKSGPQSTWLYTASPNSGGNWLTWNSGYITDIPIIPKFNTFDNSNAGFLIDLTDNDGYYYLLYAGTTDRKSYAHRGYNQLGLSRSKSLRADDWVSPPN